MAELTGFQPVGGEAKALEGFKPVGQPDFTPDSYSRSAGDAVKEFGRQLVGGAVVDAPRIIGQGLQWLGDPESAGARVGRNMEANAEARAPEYEPHNVGAGVVGETMSMGARAVGPMVPAIGAGLLGGPRAAAGVAGMQFGFGSAQDTKEKLMAQGGGEQESRNAGALTGMVQGPLEGVATLMGAKMFSPGMGAIVGQMTGSPVKQFAKKFGLNMLTQPATEVAQDLTTEAIERSYGAKPEDAWEMAKDSAQGAVGLTLLMGPFAAGAQMGHAKRNRAFDAALNNPHAPEPLRQQAEQVVMQAAEQQGVSPDEIAQWKAERDALRAQTPTTPPPSTNVLAGQTAKDHEAKLAEAPPPAPGPIPGFTSVDGSTQTPLLPPQVAEQAAAPVVAQQQAAAAEPTPEQALIAEKRAQIEQRKGMEAEANKTLTGGDASIKVPTSYTDVMVELDTVNKMEGKLNPETYQDLKAQLIASLQTNDRKSLQTVRKTVAEFTKPAKPVVEKPAAAPKPVAEKPAPAKPAENLSGPVTIIKPGAEPVVSAQTPTEAPSKPVETKTAPVAPTPSPVEAPKPVVVTKKGPRRVKKDEVAAPAPIAPRVVQPAPVVTSAKKFDNLPDLADAVAKENKLPQAVSDAYREHYILGRSHADIAKDLGVGKSTVGDMLRSFKPLMDEASITRYDRSGETVMQETADDVVVPDVVEGETAAEPAVADTTIEATEDISETVDDNVVGEEFTAGGDLADEDNASQGQADLADGTGMINIADSPHGEGKTSADNNIDKDRLKVLEKRWTQLNQRLPEKERVEWKKLGSAQQDAFDAAANKSEKQQTKMHDTLTVEANDGRKYLKKGVASKPAYSLAGVTGILGTFFPGNLTVAPNYLADQTINHYLSIRGAPAEVVEFEDGSRVRLLPLRSHNKILSPIALAIRELTKGEFGSFFTNIMNGLDVVHAFTAPAEAPIDVALAFYSRGMKGVAVNAGTEAAQNAYKDLRSYQEIVSFLAHEFTHAADHQAGGDDYVSLRMGSRTMMYVSVEANGQLEVVMPDKLMREVVEVAMEMVANDTKDGNPFRQLLYPLDDVMTAMNELEMLPVEKRFDVFLKNAKKIAEAEAHAQTEIMPTLVQLRLENPELLKQAMPEAYAVTSKLLAATTPEEVYNAFMEDRYARTDQSSKAGRPQGQGGRSALSFARKAGGEAVVGADGGTQGAVQEPVRVRAESDDGQRQDVPGGDRGRVEDGQARPPEAASSGNGQGNGGLNVPPPLRGGPKEFAKSLWTEKLYRTFPSLLGALSVEQLADRFQEHPMVQKFAEATQRMGGLANRIMGDANHVIQDWQKANKMFDKNTQFGQLLLDSTTEGMWPNKEFMDPSHDYLRPTQQEGESDADYGKRLAPIKAIHTRLATAYRALPDAYKKLFSQVEATNRANFQRHIEADRKALVQSYYGGLQEKNAPPRALIDEAAALPKSQRVSFRNKQDPATQQRLKDLWESLDQHHSDYGNKLAGPYFPKSRFGDHIVNYRSPEFIKAQRNVELANAALADSMKGDGQDERVELEAELKSLARKRKRATTQETGVRLDGEIKLAEARLAELSKEVDLAKADVQEMEQAFNALKADATHYSVEFYENRAEAQQRLQQLQSFFGSDGMQVQYSLRDQFLLRNDSLTPSYVTRIADHLTSSLTGADADQVRATVREMYITHLPGTSALKHQLKRRNVPGVKAEEALRSFSAKAVKDAYAISRKEHGGDMHDAVSGLRYGDNSNEDAKLLGNELAKRIALNSGLKTNAAIAAASEVTYFMQLGLSPGFMLMQATQQWINTAPMMAARHGVGSATKQLAKGTADASKLLKVSFSESGKKMHFDVDTDAGIKAGIINEREAAMLKEMFARGRIDVASAHDAGIAAQGRDQNMLGRAAQMANWPVQQLEVINRVSTALAGFRAETQRQVREGADMPKATVAATRYADRLVSESHMNYASENRARFIHPNSWGGWGRIMFQFRAYQQGMAYLTARNIIDGLRGDKEALKAGVYMTAVQLGVAGLAGMPIPGSMIVVASMIYAGFTEDDDERDLKEVFFQGLKSVGGESFALLATKGIPAALGVDLSQKLGAGHVFDVAPFVRNHDDGRDMTAAYFMSVVGGAAGGQVANYAEAIRQASAGEFAKASTLMLPRFASDIVKAEEFQRVGLKDSRGNTILAPGEISAAETAIKALGLTPTDIGRVQDERQAFFEARQNRKDVRAKLLATYARAKIAGESVSEINAKIEGFNKRHPEVKINQGTKAVSVSKRLADQKRVKNGVPVRRNEEELYESVLGDDD